MALYVSAGRRRRTAIIAGVVALVVGLAAGFGIGRAGAPTIEDKITEARAAGERFAGSLRVLPLEYEQMMSSAEGANNNPSDIIDRALAGEPAALGAAPWLNGGATSRLDAALKRLRSAPEDKMAPADFSATVDEAAAEVERLWGVRAAEAPG